MSKNINIGDTVLYVDTETRYNGKRMTSVRVTKWGTWDGEMVVLNDEEKTTVRNKEWLRVTHDVKYQSTEKLLDELIRLGALVSRHFSFATHGEIDKIKSIILCRTNNF